MLIKATEKYEKLNLKDNELERIQKQEKEFKVLTKTNKFNKCL